MKEVSFEELKKFVEENKELDCDNDSNSLRTLFDNKAKNILSDFYCFRSMLEYLDNQSTYLTALKDFQKVIEDDLVGLTKWIKKYSPVGYNQSIFFYSEYLNWDFMPPKNYLKISNKYFVSIKPFQEVVAFYSLCKLLYWDFDFYDIKDDTHIPYEKKKIVKNDVMKIINKNY